MAVEKIDTGRPRRGTMVATVAEALRERIAAGEFEAGSRLPSEARLVEQHGVSRTVVREAIAQLRADGLVEPRQGAGVFVLPRDRNVSAPFSDVDYERVSSVIEMLELRIAVEAEAAGLAAQRRSPAQAEEVLEACEAVSARIRAGEGTSEADFAFHLAIAEATNNPLFPEFLTMLGARAIPRHALRPDRSERVPGDYLTFIEAEHAVIAQAIMDRDAEAARAAMRTHLEGSQSRYRSLIRRS
jgi:DNA-binding FadR family transcriptional regulator